jgi:ribosome-associated toxin RatA of RatAB toxin-antitoxin module
LYGEPRHVVITETILIREVLWLVINLEITCTQKRTNQIAGYSIYNVLIGQFFRTNSKVLSKEKGQIDKQWSTKDYTEIRKDWAIGPHNKLEVSIDALEG